MTMKKRLTLLVSVVALALLASGASAKANLVVNGNFDDTAVGANGGFITGSYAWETISAPGNVGGWNVTAGSVDLIATYWQSPPGGGNSLDMAGVSSGTINQTISGLVVGQEYELTFAMSGNPDGPPTVKQLGVGLTIGGASPYAFSYTLGPNNSRQNMLYQSETEFFTATRTSELLQFQDQSSYNGSTAYGAVIGNISLAAVPEPSTMIAGALALLPFGVTALRNLRKRQLA
jgi:choice-of-anchor C domain-containing protein